MKVGAITAHTIGEVGDKTGQWSDHHVTSAEQILRTNPHPAANPPGGIKISLADINWDEGEWPFQGYFGLFYGTP